MRQGKPRIGFIGVGLMGHGMASNLLKAGYALTVRAHRNRQPIDDLRDKGAGEAVSAAELSETSDLIAFCLSNSDVVEAVIAELEPHLRSGQILLDMGTSRPQSNQAIAERLAGIGVEFAEAPVAGGPEQAAAAELGAMVGASPEVFKEIKSVLAAYCSRISHMGPVGAGQTAKLINNYLVCGMIGLIADCYNGARTAGIDWAKLFDVMQCGSNNSRALQKIVGPAIEGDFDGYQFSIANAGKDVGYYRDVAAELGIGSPLAETVYDVFAQSIAAGMGDKMVSRLIDPDAQH